MYPSTSSELSSVAARASNVAAFLTPTNASPSSGTVTAITQSTPSIVKDSSFGPQLGSRFDFTLLFEHAIFTAIPAGLLIAACPFYIYFRRHDKVQVQRGKLFWIKLSAALALFTVQITQLAIWTETPQSTINSEWAIATSSLSCFAAICIALMVNTEHRRAIQPSTILGIYFATSVIFDIVKARSYFLRNSLDTIAIMQVCIVIAKSALLILEEIPKTSLLKDVNVRQSVGREASSGFWTRAFGLWMYETFAMGFFNIISIDDLGSLPPNFATALLAQQFEILWQNADYSRRFCLVFATFKVCWQPFLLAIIPRLLVSVCSLSQPFLIHSAISIIKDENASDAEKLGLVFATILTYGGMALFRSITTSLLDRTNTLVRGTLTRKICLKTYRLPSKDAADGASMTLSTTDIDAILQGIPFIHELWVSFIEIGFIMYFLWLFIGYSCFLLLIPTFVTFFGSMIFGPRVGAAQRKWNSKIQDRVGKTTQILAQAKQVKTLGFRTTLSDYIQGLRLIELNSQRNYRLYNSFIVIISMGSKGLTPVLMVAGALFLANLPVPLDPDQIFAILAIIQLSSSPLRYMVEVYGRMSSLFTCFDRIREFLLLPEQTDERSHTRPIRAVSPPDLDIDVASKAFINRPIDLQEAVMGHETSTTPVLWNTDLMVPQGYLAIATGPNGSGKSTLLKNLIGEGKILKGQVYVTEGPIAYCDQKPWLRNVSIRDNILGYLPFNSKWYETVLNCCCLTEDLQQMPSGDRTIAGNEGSKLSGGQRQRICLARAIYSRSPVLVLDDVFSALDDSTARRVFAELFNQGGLLRQLGTTTVLATQKAAFFDAADIQLAFNAHRQVVMKKGKGCEVNSNSVPSKSNSKKPMPDDKTEVTDAEKALDAIKKKSSFYHKSDFTIYKFFVGAGSTMLFLLFLAMSAATTMGERIPGIFMRDWLENSPNSRGRFLGYALLGTTSIFGYLGMTLVFFHNLVPQYGLRLHKMLVDSMLGATIPYLTSTDHGILINRISQYMTLITQQFARDFFKLPYAFFNVVADVGIIASASYYTVIIVPIICILLYFVQLVYLQTSRQLRVIDLEATTPMYSLLAEAGSGIKHMRAFGWEENYVQQAHEILDSSQRPFYSMACIQRWLKFVLDAINAFIALVLMCLAMFTDSITSQSSLGLAFVTLMGLANCITFFMGQWIAIETSLGSLAGIRSFVNETPVEKDADNEGSDDKAQLPESWPQTGSIEFKDVTAFYANGEDSTAALKDLSVNIADKEKAAIKGRTGSGKSSVFLTLLNCLSYEGSIKIDGHELRDIPLDRLRTRIALCPQENLKLPGTIRQNLMPWLLNDPNMGRVHDFGIAEILKHLDLIDAIIAADGLDAPMDNLVLSAGHEQLFSIARTMLTKIYRSSKIILMDEVTSSLDVSKEDMILNAIQIAFDECTVLTIAHRQRTIDKAEKVYKMKHGNMKSEENEDSASDETSDTSKSTTDSAGDSDSDGGGEGSDEPSPHITASSKLEKQQQSILATKPADLEPSEKPPDICIQESEDSSSLSPEPTPTEPRPQKGDRTRYVAIAQEFIQYAQETTNAVELLQKSHAAEYGPLYEIGASVPERAPEEIAAPYSMLTADTPYPFDPVRGPMICMAHIDLPFFQRLDDRASFNKRRRNDKGVPLGPIPRPTELLDPEKSVLDRVLDNLERFEEDPEAKTPQNRINWTKYSVAEVMEISKLCKAEKDEIYERYV